MITLDGKGSRTSKRNEKNRREKKVFSAIDSFKIQLDTELTVEGFWVRNWNLLIARHLT